MFRYVNGDLQKADIFRFAVRERIKVLADDSWMPWGLEIVPEQIVSEYGKRMQDNSRAVPELFGGYARRDVDVQANMVIETMMDNYFNQRYLYGVAGRK